MAGFARCLLMICFASIVLRAPSGVTAQEKPAPADEPMLRIEAGGPQNFVTSLAFDPSGEMLYAAGWDKVVYAWKRDPQSGLFILQPNATLRVPIGPGLLGAINALAISPDGRWLAAGGHGIFQGAASFRQSGRVVPSEAILTSDMRRDEGLIYVFDLRENSIRTLRGHAGSVVALTFAPGPAETPVLVSAAREWLESNNRPGAFSGYARVWNVTAGDNANLVLAETKFPEASGRRLGLAARRTGDQLNDIEVAIQVGDEQYRSWHVGNNRLQTVPCGKYGNALAFSRLRNAFLTGLLNEENNDFRGQLELRLAERVERRHSLAATTSRDYFIPRALAIGSAGQESEFAAVVSRPLPRDQQTNRAAKYMLQVVPLNRNGFGQTSPAVPLWDVSSTVAVPTIACSPKGNLVAVAGGIDHSIWLFNTSDIRQNAVPFQKLRSAGTHWQQVSFVRKQNQRGMRLQGPSGTLLFDFMEQAAIASDPAWKDDSAVAGDWKLSPEKTQSGVYNLSRGARRISQIILPDGERLSAYAVLPQPEAAAGGGSPGTLIAIASHDLGQPTLRLHLAETGQPFRQLTGHSQLIDNLAFDRSGRLIASVAADQTVCLWSLSNLDSIIGRHGTLAATTVAAAGDDSQRIVAVRVGAAAPQKLRDNLRPGDILESATVGGQSRRWTSLREFSDAFWAMTPGTTAELTVSRQGETQKISVPVGQGTDEVKPLLSLFFLAPAANQPQQWIAWTPMGPYEASHRDVEQFLGWHFNPDANGTSTFAAASEYRETYYREGLIRELVETGSLQTRRIPPPTAIAIGFGPEAQQEWTSGESILIRQPPQTMKVLIAGLDPQRVASLEAIIDGKTFQNFTCGPEGEWVTEIAGLDWQLGHRTCRCVIRTTETPAQEFIFDETIQFQPPRPTIVTDLPADQVVATPTFRFEAAVEPRGSGPVAVQIAHMGKSVDSATIQGKSLNIEQELSLEPGDNLVEITAVNQGTPAEQLANETTRKVYRVTYRKAKTLPPKIELTRVEVLATGTEEWRPLASSSTDSLLTTSEPRARIRGVVRAEEPLSASHWILESSGDASSGRKELAAEKAADANQWQFTQIVDLLPGNQRIRFIGRCADSDEASAALNIEFRPPLPEIAWDESSESGVIEHDTSQPPAEVTLTGKLLYSNPSNRKYSFEAQVLNGQSVVAKPEIDLEKGTVAAKVQLNGGENAIRIRLTNSWNAESTSAVRVWHYRRLPRITNTSHTPIGQNPFTNVKAVVECPADRPPTQITIGGRPIEPATFRQVETRDNLSVWEATATDLPLRPGVNTIAVTATNADGMSRGPANLELSYTGTYWNPPKIDFVRGAPSENVSVADYALDFYLESPSGLKNVRVEHDRTLLGKDQMKVTAIDGRGEAKRWEGRTRLKLNEGVNRLIVRVQNQGGETQAVRLVNYIPPPVTLQIVSLEPEGKPDLAIRPVVRSGGELQFVEPISSGNARLRGVVRSNVSKTRGPALAELRIWANGFQQAPVVLESGMTEQEFSAPIVLSEQKKNLIALDIAGAPLDGNSRAVFTVDCLDPQAAQRLHLLVIGANQTDAAAISRRALTAVRAETDDEGSFREPLRAAGFYRINAYKPLIGNITFSDVFRLLLQVKSDLKIPVAPGPNSTRPLAINDVVMLYYEGGILVPDKQHFYLSTSERFDPKNRYSAIGSDWLAAFFDSMRGAQLAFIDVAANRPPLEVPVSDWRHDSHAALLCYAWQRGFKPPENLRLLRAVDQALGTAGRLGEVDIELAKFSESAPELDYNRVVPEGLKSLILTRR